MKKVIFLLVMLIGFVSCQKEKAPEPKPTQIDAWMIDAGFQRVPLIMDEPILKSSNWWDANGIQITWDSSLGNGISPLGDIVLNNGESMQLSYELLEPPSDGAIIAWYTNDSQIASINWVGMLSGTWIGTWFQGYPNLTCIYLYYYRPNSKYNGHNKKWLDPYIDNVVVYIQD